MTPELVSVNAPESMVPLVVREMLLVAFKLASAFRVVLLLAKVTVPVPSALLLLKAKVPALIVVPPV